MRLYKTLIYCRKRKVLSFLAINESVNRSFAIKKVIAFNKHVLTINNGKTCWAWRQIGPLGEENCSSYDPSVGGTEVVVKLITYNIRMLIFSKAIPVSSNRLRDVEATQLNSLLLGACSQKKSRNWRDCNKSFENPLNKYSSILTLFCCCSCWFQCNIYQKKCNL